MIWNYYHLKRWNIEFTRNHDIFKNSLLFKNDEEKNISCTWTTIGIYYNKLQKKLFQNSSIWKSFFWQKGHAIFFSNNPIGSLYLICTPFYILVTLLETII
jgi:S-adenosylmethionine:diacylglycerol 3-amino-3-carboxypropyl transferase